MLCTEVEHVVTGLEELTFVFWLLEICAILGLNLNSTCYRHGGHLLRSGRSQWSYTNVTPKLLHVWPDLAEAASKANYLFPHGNEKPVFPSQEWWWSSAWHIWKSGLRASVGKRICFRWEGCLCPHAAPREGTGAPAEFYFSKLTLLVDWPVGRSRVGSGELDMTWDWLV